MESNGIDEIPWKARSNDPGERRSASNSSSSGNASRRWRTFSGFERLRTVPRTRKPRRVSSAITEPATYPEAPVTATSFAAAADDMASGTREQARERRIGDEHFVLAGSCFIAIRKAGVPRFILVSSRREISRFRTIIALHPQSVAGGGRRASCWCYQSPSPLRCQQEADCHASNRNSSTLHDGFDVVFMYCTP